MMANYMEADGQMSSLSLQHRTRISRFKFNVGDSEITLRKSPSSQAILKDDCIYNSQKESDQRFAANPHFKEILHST